MPWEAILTFVPHLSPLMVNGSMTFQLFPSLVIAITDLSVDGLVDAGDIARSVTKLQLLLGVFTVPKGFYLKPKLILLSLL